MSVWRIPVPSLDLAWTEEPDLLVLAATVLGEAEGEAQAGRRAVAYVAMHRATDAGMRWPRTISGVCLQPKQFSCFDDEHRERVMRDPKAYVPENVWEECFRAAVEAMFGYLPAMIGGANHYLCEATCKASGGLPGWFKEDKVTARIGRHCFLRI